MKSELRVKTENQAMAKKRHSTGRVHKEYRENKNSGYHVGVCGKIKERECIMSNQISDETVETTLTYPDPNNEDQNITQVVELPMYLSVRCQKCKAEVKCKLTDVSDNTDFTDIPEGRYDGTCECCGIRLYAATRPDQNNRLTGVKDITHDILYLPKEPFDLLLSSYLATIKAIEESLNQNDLEDDDFKEFRQNYLSRNKLYER